MPVYRVLSTVWEIVSAPSIHIHLQAIEMVVETSTELIPSMAWTVEDILREDDARFAFGSVSVMASIEVGVGLCSICGQRVLRILPEHAERALSTAPN